MIAKPGCLQRVTTAAKEKPRRSGAAPGKILTLHRAADRVLRPTQCILYLSASLLRGAFPLEFLVAYNFARRFFHCALRLMGRTADTIFVHVMLLRFACEAHLAFGEIIPSDESGTPPGKD